MYGSDRSLQCCFPIDDVLLLSGDIHYQGTKLSEKYERPNKLILGGLKQQSYFVHL